MASSDLTSTQVAERLNVAPATVRLWCSQGKFKHARLVEHPRGDYWIIPENDLLGFEKPRMGRPPKALRASDTKKSSLPATPKFGSIELQTKTTRKLDPGIKQTAEKEMGGRKKSGGR